MPDATEPALSPLLQEVAGPISAADPAGGDVSYDDDFLALKDQVDQISSVSPEGVDYDAIIKNSRAILREKSKDFRVATYLALALARTSGFRGVMEGILAQKILAESHWELAYPPIKRMRARQNAFQFAAERLTESLQGLKPLADDRHAIESSLEALKELQAFTMEAMGDLAPVWSGLSRALDDALRKAPKETVEEAPTTDALPTDGSASAAQRPAPSSTTQPATPLPRAEIQTESEAIERLIVVATFLRGQAPSDPVPYRLARCAGWDSIIAEPMNKAGATLFQGPAPHRLTYLNTLSDTGDWKTLLDVAEDAFLEAPLHFWLDLQRFVAAAMDGLGQEYARAKQAVLLETAVLIRRIRSLPQLTFMDGTPFADAKTKFWLDESVLPVLASGSSNDSAAEDEELTGQLEEAKKLASGGKLENALGVLQDGLRHDAARRGRFLRRFYMAQICMQADKPQIARPILEKLQLEIEKHALHEWEPNLAIDVWSHLHQCYGLLTTDDSTSAQQMRQNAERVFARICEVDAARALAR